MTYDLSHLPASLRPQAFGCAEDRIRQVHTAHWVGYSRADLFLEHFERLLVRLGQQRLQGMIVRPLAGHLSAFLTQRNERPE